MRIALASLIMVATLFGPFQTARADEDDAQLRAQVLTAIERAQQFLFSQQKGDGSFESEFFATHDVGATSLVLLALLNSGVPADEPRIVRGLDYLRKVQADEPTETYDVSMMLMALAAADQPRDRGAIARLAQRLESYQHLSGAGGAAWGYGAQDAAPGAWWDNSNSQYALLALREAAYAGIVVDESVWRRAQEHWLNQQTIGGNARGWIYTEGRGGDGTGSMTVAGIASLTITSSMLRNFKDETEDGRIDCCGAADDEERVRKALDDGIRWLGQNFTVRSNPREGTWHLYYLYGLERAGRLSGRRFFGEHDWYRTGARFLVDTQAVRTGSWQPEAGQRDAVVGTSFVLLFLSKGLSPVLINKLKFGISPDAGPEPDHSYWDQHPRDISNLTNYISGREGWPKLVTWQVLDLKQAANGGGPSVLLQAPIQFMGGSSNPNVISDTEVNLLREYLLQGGFLLGVQACERSEFDDGFRNLVSRLFPDGEFKLEKLPETHDVYRSEFVLTDNPPELWGVDLGCRTAVMYAPYDHACRWDRWMRHDPPERPVAVRTQIDRSMKLGVNIVAYVTGRELADWLETPALVDLNADDPLNRGRLTIARLRHTGGWDTAPNALQHVRLSLQKIGIDMSPLSPTIPANDKTLFNYPLVYMHGRTNFAMTDEEREQLGTYLRNGGFLFADASCGAPQFDASFRELMTQVLGQPLERIPIDRELYQNPLGHDIRRVRRRIPTDDQQSALNVQESIGAPVLEGIEIDGRYVVVYSKYDLSCALEREATVACAGYPTEDAAKIAVNIVLFGLFQ
jgi:Domain of unknown function (DUF4159)